MKKLFVSAAVGLLLSIGASAQAGGMDYDGYVFQSGHPSLHEFSASSGARVLDSNALSWINGGSAKMTAEQVDGFKVFVGKGNCASCHGGDKMHDGVLGKSARSVDLIIARYEGIGSAKPLTTYERGALASFLSSLKPRT